MPEHVYDDAGRRRWLSLADGRRADEELFDASVHQWVPVIKRAWYERIPMWLELAMVGGGMLLLRDLVADWL